MNNNSRQESFFMKTLNSEKIKYDNMYKLFLLWIPWQVHRSNCRKSQVTRWIKQNHNAVLLLFLDKIGFILYLFSVCLSAIPTHGKNIDVEHVNSMKQSTRTRSFTWTQPYDPTVPLSIFYKHKLMCLHGITVCTIYKWYYIFDRYIVLKM